MLKDGEQNTKSNTTVHETDQNTYDVCHNP